MLLFYSKGIIQPLRNALYGSFLIPSPSLMVRNANFLPFPPVT